MGSKSMVQVYLTSSRAIKKQITLCAKIIIATKKSILLDLLQASFLANSSIKVQVKYYNNLTLLYNYRNKNKTWNNNNNYSNNSNNNHNNNNNCSNNSNNNNNSNCNKNNSNNYNNNNNNNNNRNNNNNHNYSNNYNNSPTTINNNRYNLKITFQILLISI